MIKHYNIDIETTINLLMLVDEIESKNNKVRIAKGYYLLKPKKSKFTWLRRFL